MRICTPIQVRYAETDQMGIVYHGNYALYLEDARTDFLNKIGYPYAQMEHAGYLSPVVDLHVRYGAPIHYGDKVIIRTRIIENKPAKTTYAYEFFKEGMDMENDRPLAIADSVHCLVDAKTFRPASIKKAMPDLYEAYERVKEAE